jgi:hypothetical protein
MRYLKYCILAAMLICRFAMPGLAEQNTLESEGSTHNGQGYVFFAPGALVTEGHSIGVVHIGGGGEANI